MTPPRMSLSWFTFAYVLIGVSSPGTSLAQTLQITSPPSGTVVHPGQTVTVTVADSPTGSFQQVIVIGQGAIGFSQLLTAPPYQFSITIPPDLRPRTYTITADGTIVPGQGASSDPVTLAVERPDSPTSIYAEPSVLDFQLPGDSTSLRVVGNYTDGTQTDITESLNTTYVSNDPTVATVSTTGVVTAVAPGTTRIVINGSYSLQVTVRPPLLVRPPQVGLFASQSQQLTVRAMDPSMPGVNWALNPVVGTMSSSGLAVSRRPAVVGPQKT